ncbi:putative callose synthase 6 [Camellia lanceoleosa]|uniref:Callose synthase 6 n=1 Tax=Camellia lanceoleosa TaxID=1840588 RepID=A0ACC0G4C2_9ERIC|nr:putative callose synthase 6 [Camellia lanceoleosa]
MGQNQRTTGKRNPKTNFVEARTFCHLYRSFDRLWIFYILAFQAMLIVAWSGSLSNLFNEDVSKNVLSIFITSAFLTFLQEISLLSQFEHENIVQYYGTDKIRMGNVVITPFKTQTRIWLGEVLHKRLHDQLTISDLLANGELLEITTEGRRITKFDQADC